MSTITSILLSFGALIDVLLGVILVALIFFVMWPMYQYISHEQTIDE